MLEYDGLSAGFLVLSKAVVFDERLLREHLVRFVYTGESLTALAAALEGEYAAISSGAGVPPAPSKNIIIHAVHAVLALMDYRQGNGLGCPVCLASPRGVVIDGSEAAALRHHSAGDLPEDGRPYEERVYRIAPHPELVFLFGAPELRAPLVRWALAGMRTGLRRRSAEDKLPLTPDDVTRLLELLCAHAFSASVAPVLRRRVYALLQMLALPLLQGAVACPIRLAPLLLLVVDSSTAPVFSGNPNVCAVPLLHARAGYYSAGGGAHGHEAQLARSGEVAGALCAGMQHCGNASVVVRDLRRAWSAAKLSAAAATGGAAGAGGAVVHVEVTAPGSRPPELGCWVDEASSRSAGFRPDQR